MSVESSSPFRMARPKRSRKFDVTIIVAALVAIVLTLLVMTGAHARQLATFDNYPAGTIVIKTTQRQLFLTLGNGTAIQYPVAVGKDGKRWSGIAHVDGKYIRPAWAPPEEVRRDHPELGLIQGGAPNNPMGERALTLDRDQIAIHGTNRPSSIGTFASYGCIRMFNADIIDLFDRVKVGTQVVVLP